METTFREELVFFPCGEVSLAGVLARPERPNGQAILIPWGGGSFPSSARNRVRARLARTLAERGFHTFRFDNIGVGESEGEYKTPDLSKSNRAEIVAASAFLKSLGLTRHLVIAHCFGGWSTLLAAPELEGLEGVVLLNSPVGRDHLQVRAGDGDLRWWMSKLRRVRWRHLVQASRRIRYRKALVAKASALVGARGRSAAKFSDAVGYLIDRQIPLLLLYGTDDSRADLELELKRGLRSRLEAAGRSTLLVTVPEPLEGFATLTAQKLLFDTVVPWLDDIASTASYRA
jgi:putative redox protein